jgi:hypothetical protein
MRQVIQSRLKMNPHISGRTVINFALNNIFGW